MTTAEQLLTIARGYLGTKDGDNFVRKYNEYTNIGIPLGSYWCAMFVSCVARMAGIPTTEIPNFHGCTTGTRQFKSMNRWKDRSSGYTPKPGDVIIFDWNPSAYDGQDHTGFVERVENGKVYTIEGNAGNNGVCMSKEYPLTSTLITGYGTPKYVEETINKTEEIDMTKAEVQAMIQTEAKAIADMQIKAYFAALEKKAVSKWAKKDWDKIVESGIMDGTMPRAPLAREQAAAIMNRLGLLDNLK